MYIVSEAISHMIKNITLGGEKAGKNMVLSLSHTRSKNTQQESLSIHHSRKGFS